MCFSVIILIVIIYVYRFITLLYQYVFQFGKLSTFKVLNQEGDVGRDVGGEGGLKIR